MGFLVPSGEGVSDGLPFRETEMSKNQINSLRDILVQAIEASGHSVSGTTDSRAAEHGEPAWVCNARGLLADTGQSADVLEIRKVLVLSTGHLTKATCLNYKDWPKIADFEEGCYFYVGDEPNLYADAPADLQSVLEFARQLGCIEVKFDQDAGRIEQLPWFDW